jgi:hypothetical protein
MTAQLEALLHLATVIDLKHEKMELALTASRRSHLLSQIELLTKLFEREYTDFLALDGDAPTHVEHDLIHGRVAWHTSAQPAEGASASRNLDHRNARGETPQVLCNPLRTIAARGLAISNPAPHLLVPVSFTT